MGILRYPDNVENRDTPYVLFQTKRAQYDGRGNQTLTVADGNGCAIYMPQNIAVNDSQRYEATSTGVVGAAFDAAFKGGKVTMEDVRGAAMSNPDVIAGIVGAGLGAVTSGAGGAVVGGLASASVVGGIVAEAQKNVQNTLNPREFMLFKAPTIRTFSMEFNFAPKNLAEANNVPAIIKYFRQASYPISSGFTYNFPLAFVVTFAKSSEMIKLPQVVCTSTSVTYNPNSQSYFEHNNMPVEVTLALSFQELQPIDAQLVGDGF
jgi:hypothetical protein